MIWLSAEHCHSFKIVQVGTQIHFQKINVAQVALVRALLSTKETNLHSNTISPLVYVLKVKVILHLFVLWPSAMSSQLRQSIRRLARRESVPIKIIIRCRILMRQKASIKVRQRRTLHDIEILKYHYITFWIDDMWTFKCQHCDC